MSEDVEEHECTNCGGPGWKPELGWCPYRDNPGQDYKLDLGARCNCCAVCELNCYERYMEKDNHDG